MPPMSSSAIYILSYLRVCGLKGWVWGEEGGGGQRLMGNGTVDSQHGIRVEGCTEGVMNLHLFLGLYAWLRTLLIYSLRVGALFIKALTS
jgi:hypothetical protein